MLAVANTQARSLRPVKAYRTASMEVTQASGEFSKNDRVILTEWSNPKQGQSLALNKGNLLVLDVNGKETSLIITSIKDAGCGSKLATAVNLKVTRDYAGKDETEIKLTDHTTRTCKDARPNRWEATVTQSPLLTDRLVSHMHIQGNPQNVLGSISPVLTSDLEKFLVDPKVWFANDKFSHATITINLEKKTIVLFMARRFYCPPGQFCPMGMPAPITISLPITEIKGGECNTTIYVAQKDQRFADGSLQRLEVQDNREFYKNCRSILAVPGVKVSYDTISSRMSSEEMTTHSEFTGDYLHHPIAK